MVRMGPAQGLFAQRCVLLFQVAVLFRHDSDIRIFFKLGLHYRLMKEQKVTQIRGLSCDSIANGCDQCVCGQECLPRFEIHVRSRTLYAIKRVYGDE